jgi:transposase
MLRTKSPQVSFFGSYLYDRIVPSDHLLRRINQTVDFSFVHDLLLDRYTPGFGRPAEDPEFMLRLCLLQYLYGDFDRRVIENARLNLAYKYFLGLQVDGEVPDDTTLSHFRAQRLGEEAFRKVFENIVRQCIDKGLVTGRHQSLDSTHVVADMAVVSLSNLLALCRRNVTREVEKQDPGIGTRLSLSEWRDTREQKYARMEEGLEKELSQSASLLDEVTRQMGQGKIRLTPEIQTNLELLEKAVSDRENESVDRLVSPVDPDARQGRKESKTWAGYKAHLAMEQGSEIITAVETTPGNRNDGQLLPVLLCQQRDTHGLTPEALSADRAYQSNANLELLESLGIEGAVKLRERLNFRGPGLFTLDDFRFDPVSLRLTCPAGQVTNHSRRAVFHKDRVRRFGHNFDFRAHQCQVCALKARCHPGKKGRSVYLSYFEPTFQRMKARLASETGQELNRQRMRIEHKMADLVRFCHLRHCRYRGLPRAKIHTLLAATAANLKRMARLLWKPPGPPLDRLAMAT